MATKTSDLNSHGFTLLEVILVLVLITLFATLAVSRQSSNADVTLKASTEVLKSHLRYAQMRAMSSDSVWGVSHKNGEYWLFHDPEADGGHIDRRIALPGEMQASFDLGSRGILITEGDFTLFFDPWGRPDISASTLQFTTARQATLHLTKSGEPDATITILQNTGFIQ